MIISFYIKLTREIRINNLILKINRVVKAGKILMSFFMFFVFYSCEKTSTEPETTFFDLQGENGFVGTVDGTNAFVSILLGEEEGIAYVCDGDEDISEWFSGPVSDLTEVSFTNIEGAKITASLIDNSFKGEISLRDGRNFSFKATVNTGNYGGIYKVLDEKAVQAEIEASWVIVSEEDQRGSIKFKSVSMPNITLSKSKLKDISDGSSNTIMIQQIPFSIFRYKVKEPSPPAPFVPIPYPNTN